MPLLFWEMRFKPEDIVVINLSGRGDEDLNTYIDYFKLAKGLTLNHFQALAIHTRRSDLKINYK
jgi:hypothetical protein